MGKTGFYTHPECRRHEMGEGHPECPDRLDAIIDRLLITGVSDALDERQATPVSIHDLELAHSKMHVAAIRGLHDELLDELAAGGPHYTQIDPDTRMNKHTFAASLRAAGSAIAATDAVIAGELENAFCAIRPPGHHAGRQEAMGFCFFNNIALAAKYALERHHLKRVAIIDFDVHHGNGTENIVANDDRILMLGFFQHPLFPFSGHDSTAKNIKNTPINAYSRGDVIRELVEMEWLPQLNEFRPEMIFISAGFDAHRLDDLGQMGLVEDDYVWMTKQLMEIANQYCEGKIVSCLEGGYNLSALGRSVAAHLKTLAEI